MIDDWRFYWDEEEADVDDIQDDDVEDDTDLDDIQDEDHIHDDDDSALWCYLTMLSWNMVYNWMTNGMNIFRESSFSRPGEWSYCLRRDSYNALEQFSCLYEWLHWSGLRTLIL